MAKNENNNKFVTEITPRDTDFAKWYTDIVKKAELVSYGSVRGFTVLRPYGYAVWENIQRLLDARFKATGHENVYMPMLIPESLLDKEKDHVAGFAPEVAWVTHGGSEPLSERLCIRPTSETLFCSHYAEVVQSYRDLPKLYNQWCSVVRWEKTTRPFLRTREFLWQEGHTVHATSAEAEEETRRMLEVYADFCEKELNMPVIRGIKTESDKFAGAVSTYCIEAMMHDGKALQAGTSHYFGDGFAKAFDIKFTDKDNTEKYPFQTSWGMTTRLIGAVIMSHGDDSGLVLPPAVAPVQVVILPVAQHKEGVLDGANDVAEVLTSVGIRVKIDDSDNTAGWKFSEYEMKGVPLRLEIGPKDIAAGQCVLVRRDTQKGDDNHKTFVKFAELANETARLLREVGAGLYAKALDNMEKRTYDCADIDGIKAVLAERGDGFVRALWCGNAECEESVKEQTGMGSRCIPLASAGNTAAGTCVCCGKAADTTVLWGKAY